MLAQRAATDIRPEQTLELARICAIAALRSQHPHTALSALEQWRIADPDADKSREWQEIWCLALAGLSSWAAGERAESLYLDSGRSAYARGMAGIFLAVRQWENGQLGETPILLENMYAAAGEDSLRAMLEQRLALQLRAARPAAASLAAGTVTRENRSRFPYSIFLLDQLQRQSILPETRAEALKALADLSLPLADPSLIQGPPPSAILLPSSLKAASGPISGNAVVLALPLSGPLGNISAKITAGAEAALRDPAFSGIPLAVIDTDQPDWIARVDALPPTVAVIGGPLQATAYAEARRQNLTSRRAFFAFMPSLEQGDEGRSAWRFFPSAEDQLDALLRFAQSLGIHGYAVLHPEEPYGKRMAALFQARVEALGGNIRSASYPPDNPTNWLRSVGNLLASNQNPAHARGATFQAIFLPDTWKNMDLIVPNIFYYNETRQLLLGTSLWEQGIAGGGFVSPQYYTLAVFPGAWKAQPPRPETERLQAALLSAGKGAADFWNGLGHDFALFSAGLHIAAGTSPAGVNAVLSSVDIAWTMAPLRWDASGRARQDLFLFSPVKGGFAPVDEAALSKAFASAWK
jgi:hypothetical protein